MTDESYSFTAARARLEEIVTQVRKKDTSLEKSLDLLEEGVRLANICTEQIDHADWAIGAAPGIEGEPVESGEAAAGDVPSTGLSAGPMDETIVVNDVAVIEDVVVLDDDGEVVAEIVEVTEFATSSDGRATDFVDADEAWAEDADAREDAEVEDDSRD